MLLWKVISIIQKIQYKALPGTQKNRLEGPLSIDISDIKNLNQDAGWLGASGSHFQICQSKDSQLEGSHMG